jgi:integrase
VGHTRDLWFTSGKRGPKRKTDKHPDNGGDKSAKRWLAVWTDPDRKEATHACATKTAAERYWQDQEADIRRGTYVDPKSSKIRVADWCDTWLAGYNRKPRSVKCARTHVAQIKAEFGTMTLQALAERPSRIRTWIARLQTEDLSASYIYSLHSRLKHILDDAVHDRLIHRNPCSRRTSPPMGRQRPYVITTAQLWQLHAAVPAYLRVSVLMGALAGTRCGEACGARPGDFDVIGDMFNPAVQWPADELKTECSLTPVPVPHSLSLDVLAHQAQFPGDWILNTPDGRQVGPWRLERAVQAARKKVKGLPEDFRYHDLRHYLASLLISEGHDVKVVQARLRHASASTTLNVYGHLWPDRDEATRASLEAVFLARPDPVENRPDGTATEPAQDR